MTTPGDGVPDDDHDQPEPPPRGHPDSHPDPDPDGTIWAHPAAAPFQGPPERPGPPPPGHAPPPPYAGGFDPYHPAFRPPDGPEPERPVRRSRTALRVVAAIVGLVLVLVVVLTASTPGLAPSGPTGLVESTYPPGATGVGGGIVLTSTGKPPSTPGPSNVLDVYEDYQCPYCGQFEESYGRVMQQLDRGGRVRVVVHLVTILDTPLGNDASTRAALAAACAAAGGRFEQFHDTVYANQPDQEGGGWTDEELSGFARTAGLDGDAFDDWRRCVERRTYADYLRQVGARAATAGVSGTPAFFLNGKPVDVRNVPPEQLLDAFGRDDV